MKVQRFARILVAFGLNVALAMSCWTANAQGASAPPTANTDQSSSSTTAAPATAAVEPGGQTETTPQGQLQEVVVTAERRSLNIQTTAVSIQAIAGSDLQLQHLNLVADLQNAVANMQVNTQGIGNNLELRGVGTTAFIPTIVSGIGVFQDGMYEPSSIQLNIPFFDLANTQVLRGPQGTFGGFASVGGEMDINTTSPNLRGFGGYIEGSYGNYSDQKVDGAINLPVTDTFALRLAYLEQTRGSFYRDNGSVLTAYAARPDQDPGAVDIHAVRLGALWKPTGNFQALLKEEYDYNNTFGFTSGEPNQASFSVPAGAPNVCPNGAAGPVCHSPYYAYSTHIPFVLNYNILDPLGSTVIDATGTLELRYTLPGGIVLRSLTGYWQDWWNNVGGSSASSFNAGFTATSQPVEDHYQQEFDLLSPTTGKLQWAAGLVWFYRNAPNSSFSTIYYPAPASLTSPEYSVGSANSLFHAEGVFGNINYQVTNSLQLQIGARENADDNSTGPFGPQFITSQIGINGKAGATGFHPCTLMHLPATYGCSNRISVGQYSDRVPTGKAGLNWTPLPGQFVYAFYARGYQPGGYNGSSSFKPAYINDYEIGWKSTDFNQHLQTSIGGFWMNYQNMQEPLTDLVTGLADNANLAPSTIKGIEVSANGRAGNFGVDLSGSYTKSALGHVLTIATYALPPGATNFGQCGLPQYPAGACTNFVPYYVNLSGEQNPYTPEEQVTLGVDYAFTVGDDASLTPRVTYAYTSSQYASIFENSDYYYMGSRHILGAFLTFQTTHWNFQAYGTNLTNEIYTSGLTGSNVFYGAPRQFGVLVRRDF